MPPLTTLSGRSHPAREAIENPPVHDSARHPLPQGRNYEGRKPVGAMPTQGHGFDKGNNVPHLQATVPTRNTHDTSAERTTFRRPYYDEDQHVA